MRTTSSSTVAGQQCAPAIWNSLNLIPSSLAIDEDLIFLPIRMSRLDFEPYDVLTLWSNPTITHLIRWRVKSSHAYLSDTLRVNLVACVADFHLQIILSPILTHMLIDSITSTVFPSQ